MSARCTCSSCRRAAAAASSRRCASTWRSGCRWRPALRRRLWQMPLNMANPVWVDAVPDLTQHIVAIKLPPRKGRCSDMAQLEALVGQAAHPAARPQPAAVEVPCHRGPGARARAARKRVAMYTQLHHAAVDGQAAVALANAILDLSPQPRAGRGAQLGPGQALRARPGRDDLRRHRQRGAADHAPDPRPARRGRFAVGGAPRRWRARSEFVSGRKRSGSLGLAPRTAAQRLGDGRARVCRASRCRCPN